MSNTGDFIGFTPCHHEPVYQQRDLDRDNEWVFTRYVADYQRACTVCGDSISGHLLSLGDIIAGNNWGPWEAIRFIVNTDESLLDEPDIRADVEQAFADVVTK